MERPDSRRLSLEEYLALEAVSSERFEFLDGNAFALATPSKNHERISGNLAMSLGPLVRARGCDFFAGGAKVVTPTGARLIPDFVVTCDKRDLSSDDDQTEAIIRHPCLIIEILSLRTLADDRSDKLDAYRSIPELSQYVLIDSRRRWILLHERMQDGSLAIRGPIQRFTATRFDERGLSIDEIYRDTTVPGLRNIAESV